MKTEFIQEQKMEKFNFLVFIDDDHPTNVYHEIILDESQICETSRFFLSPLEALAFFEELSQQKDPEIPEIIFLDINMPRMSGWEFLQKFQQLNFTQYPRVIMLSSSNYHKDVERGKEFPMVCKYLEKPLNEENLTTLFQEIFHGP